MGVLALHEKSLGLRFKGVDLEILSNIWTELSRN